MSQSLQSLLVKPLHALAGALLICLFTAGCSKAPDTKLKLPLGWLDAPDNNAYLKGNVTLAGWALSEDGIDQIVVYVDRSFNGYGKVAGSRPDVLKVYPQFAGTSDMEWTAVLDTAAIPVGAHQVLVRAVSKKGAVRDLGTIAVTVEH